MTLQKDLCKGGTILLAGRCGKGEEGRVTCGGGVSQMGHAAARALEVCLHAAAVSDCLQGTQAGAGGQIRHAVPQLFWNHT